MALASRLGNNFDQSIGRKCTSISISRKWEYNQPRIQHQVFIPNSHLQFKNQSLQLNPYLQINMRNLAFQRFVLIRNIQKLCNDAMGIAVCVEISGILYLSTRCSFTMFIINKQVKLRHLFDFAVTTYFPIALFW